MTKAIEQQKAEWIENALKSGQCAFDMLAKENGMPEIDWEAEDDAEA